ncbi:hypothetical protein Fcan01_07183 [Folsomia candida]|uniref:Uncharacterized protein n=1 Tax=Folsomia candida TaxID=158441 RepID=A0A226EMH2_FOLCA|nr:hypothetical protein Fcan01_07183 [Folsomia candida]
MRNLVVFKVGFGILLISILCSKVSGQYSEEDDEDNEELDVGQNGNLTASGNSTGPISNATLNRVLGQITNVFSNVEKLNITGIVDASLGIRNDTSVRNFVNSIMATIFCNDFLANYNNCARLKKMQ